MRPEYKNDYEQFSIMLPKPEVKAVKRLVAEKGITQADFVRGAYFLLLNGEFDAAFGIKLKNINKK